MRRTILSVLSLTLAVGGCLKTGTPAAVRASDTASVASQGFLLPDEQQGTLQIQIKWPDRTTQAVPLSANAATLWLYDSAGRFMTKQTVARPSSGNLSSQVFFRVKATMGVLVVAKLYKEAAPTDNSTPIALGTGNVNIYANNVNFVAITMNPLVEPAIAALSPAYGGVGKQVVISGINFGRMQGLACSVKFQGITAAFNRVNDGEIRATVPAGAVTGNVEVSVDGIRKTAPFEVLTGLGILPFSLPLQAYRSVPLTAIGAFSNGSARTVSAVSWSSSNPAVATVNDNGVVRPIATGSTTITAASGQVSGQANFTVNTSGAVVVARITVPPSGLASLSVPITMPSAAPGNLPVSSAP